MKQLPALIFLIAFTATTFSKAVIFVNFYANQKYIAENLCLNKAKPKMHCCGKCQLSKKIANEEDKRSQNPERKNENGSEIFLPASAAYSNSPGYQTPVKAYPPFHLNKCIHPSFDIFHPPVV